jgi:hypothetical protein
VAVLQAFKALNDSWLNHEFFYAEAEAADFKRAFLEYGARVLAVYRFN